MAPYRADPTLALACPRCGATLRPRTLGDTSIQQCRSCRGVLVDPRTLSRITDALDLGGEVRSEFPREVRAEPASGPMYLKCPRCAGLMSRRLFAPGAKVVVDQCAAHGTWFDASELRAVADFAAGGGLERAASEEAASRRARQAAAVSGARLSGELPLPASDGHDDAWPGLLSELFTWFRRDDD